MTSREQLFREAFEALRKAFDRFHEESATDEEIQARAMLVKVCRLIADDGKKRGE